MSTSTTPPPLPPRGDLRRRVLAGESVIGAFVNLGSPVVAELVARSGFDWALIDLEHGHGTETDVLPQLYAVQGTLTAALIRVATAERIRVGRALDLGADGVMLPRVDTAAQAAEIASWLRYPPEGQRGVALPARGGGYGETPHAEARERNQRVLGICQVESPESVDEADGIAAVDGVDVLFVGPTDLSHAMGMPGQFEDPRFTNALDRVVAACRAHGKAAGILLRSASEVGATRARGFTFIGIGSDLAYVYGTARATAADARTALRG